MKTSQQRKEEEQKIIQTMESAMKEKEQTSSTETRKKFYDSTTPEQIHCRRCKTLMEDGVCPTCGFRMYVPMDREKQKKIRTA